MSQELIERTFSVQGEVRLSLSNIRGSVIVASGADGTISVKAVKHTNSGNAEDTKVVIEQPTPDSVRVDTVFRNGGFLLNHQTCSVDYVVSVPRQTSVNVSVVSSSARIEGLDGDHSITSVSGDLDLYDLTGRLKLNAVSGRVRGSDVTGPIRLETVSGDITFKNCRSSKASGSTVSGDLEFDLVPGEGPYTFSSVSGNVELVIPTGVGCSLSLSSMSGRLVVDSPEGTNSLGRGRKTATVLGGGTQITLKSISGDLRLKHRHYEGKIPDPSPARESELYSAESESAFAANETPEAGTAGTGGRPSVSEVLDRVDRGEISVEEALKILGAQ